MKWMFIDEFHPNNVNSDVGDNDGDDVGSNTNNDDGNDVRMKLGTSFVTISWVHLWNINIITLCQVIGKGLWLSDQMFIFAL